MQRNNAMANEDTPTVQWGPSIPSDILRFIHEFGSAEKLIDEHTPDAHGVCPKCHVHECTLWHAAVVVKGLGGSVLDNRQHALEKKLLADVNQHGIRPKTASGSQAQARNR
jgi:hypothetical protein